MSIPYQVCSSCGDVLSAALFSRNRARSTGLSDWCKACMKQYRISRGLYKGVGSGNYPHAGHRINRTLDANKYILTSGTIIERRRERFLAELRGLDVVTPNRRMHMPKWTTYRSVNLYAKFGKLLGPGWEVDHIFPIRGLLVCGLHCPDNLQIISTCYNRQKGNRKEQQCLPNPRKT